MQKLRSDYLTLLWLSDHCTENPFIDQKTDFLTLLFLHEKTLKSTFFDDKNINFRHLRFSVKKTKKPEKTPFLMKKTNIFPASGIPEK